LEDWIEFIEQSLGKRLAACEVAIIQFELKAPLAGLEPDKFANSANADIKHRQSPSGQGGNPGNEGVSHNWPLA
jgi:hypothetical protein